MVSKHICCYCNKEFLSNYRPRKYCSFTCRLRDQKIRLTHGMSSSRFYNIYRGILSRCNNPLNNRFNNYGGRGILVEWKKFEDFKQDMYNQYIIHVNEHGEKNTTIERININGNYCKDNCKWATYKEQFSNTTKNVFIEYDNKQYTIQQAAEHFNIPYSLLYSRLRRGWTVSRSIKTPRMDSKIIFKYRQK